MNWRTPVAVCLVILCAATASAQFDSAQVSGVVQDTSGGVLPGVDVVLVADGTGLERRAVTNEAGLYTFPNVPVGDYRINAHAVRLQADRQDGRARERRRQHPRGRPARDRRAHRDVQVEAATTLVDTAVIGRTVRAEQIADTPLSARRATQVAQLVPGTIGGNMGGLPTAAGTFATGITSINGGRSEEFMTTVDGAPSIRVRANGGFTMGMQNADTVEEVQVLTTNYQAEHGRASAGLLRLVTKSGTQSSAATCSGPRQDDSLNANTWTNNRAGLDKSPHNFNAYGFTLGGPIYIPGVFNENKQSSCSSSGARNGSASARWRTRPASCRPRRCATATSASC